MGFTYITEIKKKYRYLTRFFELLQLQRFFSLWCHVTGGWGWVTVPCINTATTGKLPEGRAKTVADKKFDIEPKKKGTFGPLKFFSLTVIGRFL